MPRLRASHGTNGRPSLRGRERIVLTLVLPVEGGLSMRKISEYQDHPAECSKIAARTRDLTHKEQLEELAGAWQMLAEARLKQLERKLRRLRLTR